MSEGAPDPGPVTEGTVPARVVGDLAELVDLAELTGITVYEVAGRRLEDGDGGEERLPDEGAPQQLQVKARGNDDGVEVRVRLDQWTPAAYLMADMGVGYTFAEPAKISKDVLAEFIERLAMMAVYPFLREAVFTTATRLGVDTPVLGLLRAGQFRIEQTDTEPTSDEAASE